MTTTEANLEAQLQRALLAVGRANAKLDAVERAQHEPIAVIGVSCRFPAGGRDPESFWNALAAGADGVREIPETRWPESALEQGPGTRWAGLIEDVDAFDPAFFGISPREASSLDPQQRLLLELTWEALEDAAIVPASLMGSSTGVFVGISTHDYEHWLGTPEVGERDLYALTGIMASNAAGRLSFVLGLHGPAIALDTACSSSLVAIHLACQSLRTRDCSAAVVGGVNLILAPQSMAAIASTQALSADGRCRAFDAEANGFVRGEGCGMLVLKRLSDARRDGNRIRALIRGSAVNQDGRSTGLTTPNVLAQQALLRQALANARLVPEDVTYVETHGTGTSLGDPVEYEALKEVFGTLRPDGSSCVLGALKTNVGHLEAAAGVAGFIKVVLALEHAAIPPNLHFRTVNPHISLEGTPFAIPTELRPWPARRSPRRAGVSSFGMSGTNAHVLVEEAPPHAEAAAPRTPPASLLVLSSKTAEGLEHQAQRLAAHLAAHPAQTLNDVAYTAALGRTHHAHRLAILADSRESVARRLEAFLRGESRAGLARGVARDRPRRIAFVFPGQGGQWVGMGHALLAEEAEFRAIIERCERAMRQLTDWSLSEVLRGEGEEADLKRVDVIQPAVFAMQLGLAALWRAWGVEPAAVVGHSMGEVASACVAGALSLEDACHVVCTRSRLVRRVSGQGRMAVIELPVEEVRRALAAEPLVSIAAVNGPRTTVVAGAGRAIERLLAELESRGTFCRWVSVDYASHSPQMDVLKATLSAELHDIRPARATIAMYSTVTGDKLAGEPGANYWQDNLREPVQFWPAVEALARDGFDTFVEINAHPILLASIADGLESGRTGAAVVPSLRRDEGGRSALLGSLAELYTLGEDVASPRLFPEGGKLVELPSYAWQHERYWSESHRRSGDAERRRGHGWLGPRYHCATERGTLVWQGDLRVEGAPHLQEHLLDGSVVVAGALWMEAALYAGRASGFSGLAEMELVELLTIGPTSSVTVQVLARGSAFEVLSAPRTEDGEWTVHARGRFVKEPAPPLEVSFELDAVRSRCLTEISAADFYERARERGVEYGERFAALDRVWLGEDEAVGEVLVKDAAPERWVQEPWVLDACLQVLGATVEEDGATYLPVALGNLRVFGRLAERGIACAARRRASNGDLEGDVRVFDPSGHLLWEATAVRLRRVREAKLDRWLFASGWEEQSDSAARTSTQGPGTWLIVGDGALAASVSQRLEMAGGRAIRSPTGEAAKLARLLHEQPELAGILHLSAAEQTETDSSSAAEILTAQARGSASVLELVRSLSEAVTRKVPALWLVTRGVQAVVPEDRVRVTHSTLWGFARTLAHEHPELACTCVDLPERVDSAALDALVRELRPAAAERELALRPGRRFVGRLVRAATPALRASAPLELSADATYLITGGLGALGLEVSKTLAALGARHIVLLGRRGPGAAAQAKLDALASAGVELRIAVADVARADAIARVLEMVPPARPLRGVIHAAGVLDDTTILRAEWSRFESVFLPKVCGAFNLHTATCHMPLDFFVMFSSAAALLGSPGQANYAAANAFLDALAQHRRAAGLPALSIGWGPWSELGLAAARADRGVRLATRGVKSLSPAQGRAAFEALLASDQTQVAVMRLEPAGWRSGHPHLAELPFFAQLMKPTGAASETALRAAVRRELEALDGLPRRVRLEEYLRTEMARVLRLPVAKIHGATPIASLGFDSLMALEFRNRAEVALDLTLPASLLWTYRTVDALAPFLAEKMGLPFEPTHGHPAPAEQGSCVHLQAGVEVSSVVGMSEEDAEAALLAKLRALEAE